MAGLTGTDTTPRNEQRSFLASGDVRLSNRRLLFAGLTDPYLVT